MAQAVGGLLTVLGLAGLVAGVGLGLTLTHDLIHLGPGIAILAVGFPFARGRLRRGIFFGTGAFYVAIGAMSLVEPAVVEPTLGITAWQNGLHLVGGLGLLAAVQLLEPGDASTERAG